MSVYALNFSFLFKNIFNPVSSCSLKAMWGKKLDFLSLVVLAYVRFCLRSLNTRLLKIPVVLQTLAPFIHPHFPTKQMLTPKSASEELRKKKKLPGDKFC